MNKSKINLFLILTALLFTQSCAQEGNRILFLTFQFVKGEPHLVDMVSVKGELKTSKMKKQMPDEISFNVLSGNDVSLYSGYVADPTDQHLEYAGDNNQIGRVEVKKDSAETVIRIPYSADIQKVILKKPVSAESLQKKSGTGTYTFNIDHSLIKKD